MQRRCALSTNDTSPSGVHASPSCTLQKDTLRLGSFGLGSRQQRSRAVCSWAARAQLQYRHGRAKNGSTGIGGFKLFHDSAERIKNIVRDQSTKHDLYDLSQNGYSVGVVSIGYCGLLQAKAAAEPDELL